MEKYEMVGDFMIKFNENPDIIITGIDGLRCFIAWVANSWDEGKPVTMKAREVKFIPSKNEPEHIYCEILPVVDYDQYNPSTKFRTSTR